MRRTRGRGGNGHSNHGNQGNYSNNGPRRQSGSSVPSRHQVFDSNGPEVRIRGNAFQVYDKYLTMARDAQASGDRVKAESLLQHAEHYYRIMLAIQEATGETYQPRGQQDGEAPMDGAVIDDPAQMPQPSIEATVDMTQPQQPEAAVA